MIRLFSLTVPEYVYAWLPSHKRRNMMVQLFQKLNTPFAMLMDEFASWRDTVVTRAQVTGETISLEWYLNELFDPTNRDIYIESADASGVAAGIEDLGETFLVAGVEATEPASYVVAGLPGEGLLYGSVSFVVYIPAAIAAQEAAIARVVRSYKMAGRTFDILTF